MKKGKYFVLIVILFSLLGSQKVLAINEEEKVREFFKDTPIMIEIARCESKYRQLTDSGNVLKGGSGGQMIGVFQISEAHRSKAETLGFNIDTLEGNLGYAKYLYEKQGTDPWISSFPCWNNNTSENTVSTPSFDSSSGLTTTLTFGMVHPEVLKLQQILNKVGVKIATEGPGSPGQETEKFGFLTRDAVRKFQCYQKIVCSGDEYATSYGVVGPRTRAALLKAAEGGVQVSTTSPDPTSTNTNFSSSDNSSTNSNSSNSSSANQTDIASLQAKIAELQKIVADLQAKLAAMSR